MSTETNTLPTEIPGTGIFKGIHNDIYRNFNAVSYSDLKEWVSGEKFKPTPAMNVGKALHALVLEPDDAKNQVWTAPEDVDRRTAKGRDKYARWEKENPGKTVLLPKERDKVKLLHKSIRSNPLAMKIIEAPGDNEVSVITKLPGHSLLSKCRIDMFRRACLADLKTTGASGPDEFEQSINQFAYDGQCAYYPDQVCNITNEFLPWLWICVSTRNYLCWVTQAQPHHYASRHRWYNDILTLKERFDA